VAAYRRARNAKRKPVPVPEFVEVHRSQGDVLKGLEYELSTLRASHQSERTRRKDDGNHRLGALRPGRLSRRSAGRPAWAGGRSRTEKIMRHRPCTRHSSSMDRTTRTFSLKSAAHHLSRSGRLRIGVAQTTLSPVPSTELKTEYFPSLHVLHELVRRRPRNRRQQSLLCVPARQTRRRLPQPLMGAGLDLGYTFGRGAECALVTRRDTGRSTRT